MFYFLKIILAFFISLIVSLYFLPNLIKIAFKLNIIDSPNTQLKLHKKSVPYLGGVGIFLGFIFSSAIMLPFENNQMFLFFAGCTILLLIGLIDDIVVMTPLSKLIGQIFAVICFLKGGIHLREIFFSNTFNVLISCLWLLTIINAFNLIDVMDGLSTTVAFMCGLSFLLFAIYQASFSLAILISAFLGALFAFFFFNKPPAKMYMGDAGALFIGGFIGSVPFMLGWSDYNIFGFLTPAIITGIPVLELVSLIAIRSYKKIPFFYGSRDHFSHYMTDKEFTKNQILIFVALCSTYLFVAAFLFYTNCISFMPLFILGIAFFAMWLLVVFCK